MKSDHQLQVYLAGGFRSNWQKKVKDEVGLFKYYDPSSHSLDDPKEYTAWDLMAIKKSDIVFGYFEATNPAGYALATEMGYAKALGKMLIFVDEKSDTNIETLKYLEMLRTISDVTFDNLKDGD